MVTVTARESFNYAGIDRAVGESFEASAEDARILRLIGRVDNKPRESRQAKDVVDGDADSVAVEAPKPRRAYQRKDVIAE